MELEIDALEKSLESIRNKAINKLSVNFLNENLEQNQICSQMILTLFFGGKEADKIIKNFKKKMNRIPVDSLKISSNFADFISKVKRKNYSEENFDFQLNSIPSLFFSGINEKY